MSAWPEGRDFAFTVFDDADSQTLENGRPIYELLGGLGLRTTKSVWPVRGPGASRTTYSKVAGIAASSPPSRAPHRGSRPHARPSAGPTRRFRLRLTPAACGLSVTSPTRAARIHLDVASGRLQSRPIGAADVPHLPACLRVANGRTSANVR